MSDTIIINFSDRRAKQDFIARIGGLQGEWRVEMCRFRARRTDAQNRFYWPCVVKPLADFLTEQGQPTTSEEAHGLLRGKFLRVTMFHPETGEMLGERVRSTTELDIEEFSNFLEDSMAWLADTFGIICPSPDAFGMEGGARQTTKHTN